MKKRLFAILLALTLALSLLPTAVFATEVEDTAGTPEEPAVQSDEAGIAVQAAHTHCYCGGSVNAGDHTDHSVSITYKACTNRSQLSNIFWPTPTTSVDVAYAYLENDITFDYNLSIQEGKTLYLCLNGHTLNLGEYTILVGSRGATLYLCDCSAKKTGTVSGGGSKGCVSVYDAADNKATFNMYGGTLRDGNRSHGGGVNVENGTMNMYGGTITENTATSDGGGIYVGPKSTLNLYGGTITKNTVNTNESRHGGGVYVESNKWSGVGKISISGSPVITGNTRTYTDATTGASTTTTENLYLAYGFTNCGDLPIITLGTLTNGANIGIWAGESVFSTASETDYSGYFSSDVAGYHVAYNAEKKLELKAGAAHVHSGGTAYCSKKAVCTTCGNEYGSFDPKNHSGSKLNGWRADDNEHWQVYSCCNAEINRAAHHGGTATCESRATCEVCGTVYGDIAPNNHDWGAWTSKDADTHTRTCSRCSAVDAKEHDWDNGKVTSQATCVNAGTKTFTCTECGATKDESISATGHSWKSEWASDATHHWHECTNSYCDVTDDSQKYGYAEHSGGTATCTTKAKCEACETEYGKLNPANHTGTEQWTKTATTHEKKWSCCGAVSLSESAHNWVDSVCRDCGYACVHADNDKDHKCDTCGKTVSNHTGGTANCHAKAVCEVCKEAYGDLALDKHDGGTEVKNAKAATCTEKGYTGDTYCKGCNAKLYDGKDIPAAGHKLKHVPAKRGTSFVAGNIEYWYCTVCGKYFRDAAGTQEITKEDTVTYKESTPAQDNKTVKSSKTGDAGVMLYAGMAVLSLTGCAWLRRKEK